MQGLRIFAASPLLLAHTNAPRRGFPQRFLSYGHMTGSPPKELARLRICFTSLALFHYEAPPLAVVSEALRALAESLDFDAAWPSPCYQSLERMLGQ